MKEVCQTADLEIDWRYMKQVGIVNDDRSSRRQPLSPRSEGKCRERRFDGSAVGEAGSAALGVRCPGGIAQKAGRPRTAARGLAVEVRTALGERDATIAATEQRAGAALQAMINDEHVTVPETAQWCAGTVSRREVTRLRQLANQNPHSLRR
jgi:hypothetical protein